MSTPERLRASAVVVHDAHLLCVRMRDPLSRVVRLFVPGGAIEEGETPAVAAARETLEETGYVVRADPSSIVVARYPYTWSGTVFEVTTSFVRATLVDPTAPPALVSDATYNEGTVWLPLAEVDTTLSFDTAIHAAIRAVLGSPGERPS